MADLFRNRYRDVKCVIVVCDNLNTRTMGAFYEAFPPELERSFVRRIEFRYTPKHGSWLNIAENELSSHRLSNIKLLCEETSAWAKASNGKQCGVDWRFKIEDVRTKLKSLYPKIKY